MGRYYRAAKEYWGFLLQEDDYESLLRKGSRAERQVFCKYVHVVNIETSAYCNRRCSYCPICTHPREQAYISDALWGKIMQELQAIGYENRIALNLYNEPLCDDFLLQRIRDVRKCLPRCYMQMNSNGDRLTRERMEELLSNGLNQILITLHPPENSQYDDRDRCEAIKKFLDRLGLSEYFKTRKYIRNKNITVDIQKSGRRILIVCNNWGLYGNNRGGAVPSLGTKARRESPCVNPFREVCIAYDGKFTPCCNVYFGMDNDYGNINDNSILDSYFSDEMIEFRRKCFTWGG